MHSYYFFDQVGSGVFDPLLENPEHCSASNTTAWELSLLHYHYHQPTARYIFLEAQLLCNLIDDIELISHVSSLALSTISPLFVYQFRRTLRFCHLEFDTDAISDGCRRENARYRWGGFRQLSFCVTCFLFCLLFQHNAVV